MDSFLTQVRAWLDGYRSSVGGAAVVTVDSLSNCEAMVAQAAQPGAAEQVFEYLFELLTVLDRLSPDPQTVGCAMLFVPHAMLAAEIPTDLEELQHAQLEELLQLHHLEETHLDNTQKRNAEGLRRLLLALVQDVRVVLIGLAWQLVQLRKADPENEQLCRQLAEETLMIHAPLANRLGVWQLKWELEDLSFRYTKPEDYHRIAQLVAERRSDREQFIRGFLQKLQAILRQAGIRAEVKGRPKHIYSIWRKMQQKGLDFHQLFDVRAVRVLVEDLPACYSALGLVHTNWQPIPGEFDDYITTPKGNMYQSLHTAVIGPRGKTVEVQIRTQAMHEHAELGVAAHWRYKEGGPRDPGFDRKITVMRQLLEAGDEGVDDVSLLDNFQSVTAEDRVYVLTPAGDVVDLPRGATVLDFAYHVHTEVGHRCRGAKLNGKIVQLTQVVETGDRVEVLTGKQPSPSRDWLNPRAGYLASARSRGKVRQWFRRENYEVNLQGGKELLESELSRLNWAAADLKPVLPRYNLQKLDDLYVAIGAGDLTVTQIIQAIEREQAPEEIPLSTSKRRKTLPNTKPGKDEIVIEGVGNLMTTLARCCQPVPGDQILGYITRGRGVSIHRADCKHGLNLKQQQPQRVLEVNWGDTRQEYPVKIQLEAWDRRELIKDISTILAADQAGVLDINSQRDNGDMVTLNLTLRIRDIEQLSGLLSRLGAIANVQSVRRVS